MIYSIKSKLVLVVSLLVIFILSVTAFLLIQEKERELTRDISVRAQTFAELTADDIVKNYHLYLEQGGFFYFKKEIIGTFLKNEDISSIRIADYPGTLLYNSEEEQDKQYSEEEKRLIRDTRLLERIQSKKMSFLIRENGQTIYVKRGPEGDTLFVDNEDQPIEVMLDRQHIINVVAPVSDQFSVIYDISYQHLVNRIRSMTERIVLLMIFGIMVGFLVAYIFSARITRHLSHLSDGAKAIAKGDFQKRVTVETRDEIGLLAQTFNVMAKDLQESTKAMIFKERVAKELELAAHIQRELLPKKVPKVSGLEIAAGLIPAAEIGGDCFDFIQNGKNDFIMYIGDVTGHGVPSGLVVAIANAVIYSLVSNNTISEILIRTNEILKAKTSTNMFLTMLMANWNASKKIFRYVSAGHERMLLLHSKSKTVDQVEGGGMALGMLPDISKLLKERTLELKIGDVLVMYSDGIPEARSKKGESYGLKRFQELLKKDCAFKSAEAIKNTILSDVKEFMAGAKQEDDITLVVLVRK